MSNKHDWTEQLPEAFEGFTEAEPEGLWDAVQGSLTPQKKRIAAAWWWSAAGLAAAACVALGVFLFRDDSPVIPGDNLAVIPSEVSAVIPSEVSAVIPSEVEGSAASSLRAEAPESPGLPTTAAPSHGRSLQTAGLSGTSATPASGSVPAPYGRIPLFVRGGSIIPVGPAIEWTDEKPAEELLIVVYPGADGDFCLYEDDGVSYGYERGECSRIRFHWDDAARTLTVSPREGAYPGMETDRTFRIRLATDGWAFDPDDMGDTILFYSGNGTEIKL